MIRGVFRFLPLVLLAGFCVFSGAALLRGTDTAALPSPLVGQKAPQTPLPAALDGTDGLTAAHFAQGPYVINFFASWCPPCHAEHPQMMRLAQDYKNIPLYGIAYKDKPADLAGFVGVSGNPYAAIGADAGTATVEWGVAALPETYIVGTDGVVAYKHSGPVTREDYDRALRPVLDAMTEVSAP